MTTDTTAIERTIPIVGNLTLDHPPHLNANVCTQCGAYYFDQRDGCASCFGTEFTNTAVATEGVVETFTIVEVGAGLCSTCGVHILEKAA